MEKRQKIIKKIAKVFFIISLFLIALALANATLIERGTLNWDIPFENIWNVSHINGTIIENSSILRIGNISNILKDAFVRGNVSEYLGGVSINVSILKVSNLSNIFEAAFNKANYSVEYASTGFDRENVSDYLGGSDINSSLIKEGNLSVILVDGRIANDLTLQTTKDITIGGGFASGGITLTTVGAGNFQSLLLAGNLTLITEGEVNGSMNPANGVTARLGNASNQWTSLNVSGNGYFGSLTSIGNVDFDGDLSFVGAQSITTTTGALTLQPASGSGLTITLATTGDLAVNTNQLYVDTSTGMVGIGTTAPSSNLEIAGNITTIANSTIANNTIAIFNASCGGFRYKTGGWLLSCED